MQKRVRFRYNYSVQIIIHSTWIARVQQIFGDCKPIAPQEFAESLPSACSPFAIFTF